MNETLSTRQLHSLMYVTNVVNSSLDIEEILNSILHTTLSVIDAADGGVLFIYDKEQKCLVAKATSGFDTLILNQIRLEPGESMTGETFVKETCQLFTNVHEKKSTLSPANLKLMEDSIPHYPYSTLCAPIFLKEQCIGVITIDSFQEDKEFSDEDIPLLQAISDQAAIAIEKGNFYQEKLRSIQEFKRLNEEILRQNVLLTKSVHLHRELADLVLQGRSIQDIVDYLRDAIGVNFILLDRNADLLAKSFLPETSEKVTEAIRLSYLEGRKENTGRRQVLYIKEENQTYSARVLPLGIQLDSYGVLIPFGTSPLHEVEAAALEHACTVLSLEMVKEEVITDATVKLRGAFLEELMQGKMTDSLYQQARQLSLTEKRWYQVAHFYLVEVKEAPLLERRRLIQTVYRRCQEDFPGSIIQVQHHHVTALFPCEKEGHQEKEGVRIRHFLEQMVRLVEEQSAVFHAIAGLGRWKKGLSSVQTSGKEANQVIQFLKQHPDLESIMHYSELGMYRLLMTTPEEDINSFIDDQIGPLLDGGKKRSELFQTLVCYLDHNRNVKETAENLHIHPNTLHYRLGNIYQLLGAEQPTPDYWLNVHLAIKLRELKS
ncbi:helix-turn-helix domain-containing protein [Mangrovibacillus cuniculi]|uniref:GAF domain-containing protein n=1 Tax=Mangrovibacillus cuniculi TaxID=2593652 RepID=A0A7S8CCQ3_9BACI|nr:helix-turn-helix domain-containing protein [Mangrovibacillus cuniculi]QPC47579.1 GAF domain-containing protein [Mangrovibacillus cuniculi]